MKSRFALFVVIVVASMGRLPAQVQPLVSANLTNGNLQLTWQAYSNFSSQLQRSGNLSSWQMMLPPFAAPLTNGWLSSSVTATQLQQFFRVGHSFLTNSPVPTVPGVYTLALASGRIARSYRLQIPTNYNAAVAAPLAIMLHGHGQTAASFAGQHPDLAQQAQGAGMILVFPDSTVDDRGTGWNNYDPEPGEHYVDDAQFILDLIEYLAATLNVDRQRIYAGGFSNGGQMVHYLAARTTNTFAAYAAVGASIGGGKGGTNLIYTPSPLEARSVLIVNATNDCARPYWGGANETGFLQPAAIEAAYHWISNNVCVEDPVWLTNRYIINSNDRPNFGSDCPDFNPPPNVLLTNLVTRTTWLGCTSSVEVTFVELTDGGHLWPDAADNVGYDANAEVIQFFLRHCRCDQPSQLVVPTVAGTYDLRLCDQGYWRKFRLAIPATYNAGLATPIVFTFHGGGQTMTEFSAAHPDLFTKCNAEGVLLVLPEATRHPQELDTLWGSKPFELVSDDRAFVTNLLAQLDAALNINLDRVYACGFSSGGRMSQWMAATWPGILAAIAPVCAMTGWNDRDTGALIAPPAPLEAVPVFIVRGSLDTKQPFFGGTNAAGQLTFSAADDLAYWSSGSGCVGAPTITTVGVVTAWEYTACVGGTEVKLEGVAGLTHEWPESPAYNASVRVIDFLLRFTR